MAIKYIDYLAQMGIDLSGVSRKVKVELFLHSWGYVLPNGVIEPLETAIEDGLAHWSDIQ